MRGTGFRGLGTGEKIFAGTTLLSLLEGEEPEVKPPFTEEDYKKAYNEQVAKLGDGFSPFTGLQDLQCLNHLLPQLFMRQKVV